MVKFQISEPESLRQPKKFKRAQSTESISTVQDLQKPSGSRLISGEIKSKFIDLITKRNYSMKQAAKKVNMSYSTAKKIYRRFRTLNIVKNTVESNRNGIQAGYIQLGQGVAKGITVICLIAGNTQNC